MKTLILTLLLALISTCGFAQPIPFSSMQIDSMKHRLTQKMPDTSRVMLLYNLACGLTLLNTSESLTYSNSGVDLAKKIAYPVGELKCLEALSFVYALTGSWEKGIKANFYCLELSKKYAPQESVFINNLMSLLYQKLGDDMGSLEWAKKAYNDKLFTTTNPVNQWAALMQIAQQYERLNKLDSALFYNQKAFDYAQKKHAIGLGHIYLGFGRIAWKNGQLPEAINYTHKSIEVYKKINWEYAVYEASDVMAQIYHGQAQLDSTKKYAQIALDGGLKMKSYIVIRSASKMLASILENQNAPEAYKMLKLSEMANDTITNLEKIKQVNLLEIKEKQRIESLSLAEKEAKNRLWLNSILGILLSVSVISLILWRNNRQKQKANQVLENTLSKLKSTQAQLIQKEKLASLGELTAGIAHEIQNPLNFVNNFSEMSVELAQELKDEVKKPEKDWELIEDLAEDLSQNQAKINHHGKRASSIVSGMLEHSKASTGERALTDINKLADEYLRLSYHGIRAKDTNGSTPRFNSDYKTDFDENLPKIEVIPQDMGRVLLNLINNAFWAVKTVEMPLVTVKTEQIENQIIITVKDNGTGMTEDVKAKIFQPFFTTKPTGQGTGLGLSLAYDIVTKGHGGTIEVISTEGVGSEFIITLPLKS